jgi:hypothetical protein
MRYERKDVKNVGDTEIRVWDSLTDLIKTCDDTDPRRFEGHDHTGKHASERWVGRKFNSHAELYAALNQPWEHGLNTMERMLREIGGAELPTPTSRRRRTCYSECNGDELDYDRLRSGRDYWRTSRRQNTKGPATLTLIVDVCASASVSHTDILWRGAAAVALAKLLEAAGYRVELWAVCYTGGCYHVRGQGDVNAFVGLRLKECSEPIDASTLINAVSGWAFRTLWFQALSQGKLPIDAGLGYCRHPAKELLEEISHDEKRVLIGDAWSHEDAVELIRETLSNLTTNAKE